MFRDIISPSLSPNTDTDDVIAAWKVLISPWQWKAGSGVSKVEHWFCHYFHTDQAVSFNSGRSALYAILKAFGIGPGDEVLLQAFTCVAVPNSIRWTGAMPIFVDIDQTYNIDPSDMKKKITKHTKAIIIQHTFGIPAKLDTLLAMAKHHRLLVIEDCAHCLGGAVRGKKLGNYGDAAFFSFGRDKVVSSVFGGIAIIGKRYKLQKKKLKAIQRQLSLPSYFWIFQQLVHPIFFSIILPSYTMGVGKVLLVLLQKFRLLSFPVYELEKYGGKPQVFPQRYPNALAVLLLKQLEKIQRLNTMRRENADAYCKALGSSSLIRVPSIHAGSFYLRYPIETEYRDTIRQKAKKKGILLGNWYQGIIDPDGVVLPVVGYRVGSCPQAEKSAKHILNLPTLVDSLDRDRVIRCIAN